MPNYCAVPRCSRSGGFRWPKDPQLSLQWRVAIRREEDAGHGKKLWKPKNLDETVVCDAHFTDDDYRVPVKSTVEFGAKYRRTLKPEAVPHVFDCWKECEPDETKKRAAERRRERKEKRQRLVEDDSNAATTTTSDDDDCDDNRDDDNSNLHSNDQDESSVS